MGGRVVPEFALVLGMELSNLQGLFEQARQLLLSAPIIESRFRQTDFIDSEERERAFNAFMEDRSKVLPPKD